MNKNRYNGIRDMNGRSCTMPFRIKRHSDGSYVIGLNDYAEPSCELLSDFLV